MPTPASGLQYEVLRAGEAGTEPATGDGPLGPDLPAKSATIWELQVDKVNPVPAFKASAEAALKTTASGLKYEIIKPADDQA